MTRKVQFTLVLFIVMALFTACSQDGGRTTPLNAGIANPASENCLRQGGEVEMRQGAAGEYGVCIFADGRVCDEWALYHGVCEQHQVLSAFFNRLAAGQYAAAATLYGGSYETLVGFNPDINPVDVAALWRHGCEMNGLQCLLVRIASFNEQTAVGETIFTVQFSNPDGSLFVREACWGEEPTLPPAFEFEYRVVQGDDGQFRVLDMPVYVP
jgi:uncharacterized protein